AHVCARQKCGSGGQARSTGYRRHWHARELSHIGISYGNHRECTLSNEEGFRKMIITKKALPRRTFLRGLGTTMALPFLDAMTPALSAAPQAPVRMAFVYHPVGMIMDRWTPKEKGANFAITPAMRALEDYREYTTILSGL